MATHSVRTRDRDSLTRFLGWFSVAIGTTQVAAPRALCRAIGGGDERIMRAMGVRELTQGAGILIRPRPTTWMWSRVFGDALDLVLLGVVARNRHKRTAAAIANVLPIVAADVYEAIHLTQKSGPPQSAKRIRKVVTINKPRAEVEAAWDLDGYTPMYADAPGGRGTEVAVEVVEDPPLGDFGVLARKLSGKDDATRLADELRRFKARVETGEVVRSDSTPSGHELSEHLKQRAAAPA